MLALRASVHSPLTRQVCLFLGAGSVMRPNPFLRSVFFLFTAMPVKWVSDRRQS